MRMTIPVLLFPLAALAGPSGQRAVVEKVVDGDTLRVRLTPGGGKLTVRILGIDCPETHHNDKCEKDHKRGRPSCQQQIPWGRKATQAARGLIAGKKVILQCPGECTNGEYGRALRYVQVVDGKLLGRKNGYDFGLEMVREGLCRASRFKKGHPRFAKYRNAQKQARAAGRAMWKARPTTRRRAPAD
jgi:endonuclease YncB( thermonuclease family)